MFEVIVISFSVLMFLTITCCFKNIHQTKSIDEYVIPNQPL
jgi:hypothetical protein